jgi:copper chaperone NosL
MKQNKLKKWVRVVLFLSGLLLILVLLFPMWKIELMAPQYPEGLELKIYPNKLAGDVEIINGLNHYIGMKTLHSSDFIEFRILPYAIGFFIILILFTAIANRKSILYITTVLFVIFCIVSMFDFWQWEYNYGHHLDPEAPIQVPGMSYQPPLIGYKQLLNFTAFSFPDIGGFIFISSAALLVICTLVEIFGSKKSRSQNIVSATAIIIFIFLSTFLTACSSSLPKPIKIGKEACSYCKMTIADTHFGAEIITTTGKTYKFDDMHCFNSFLKENIVPQNNIKSMYVVNYCGNHNLIKVDENVLLYKCDLLQSPMNGNIAAFDNRDSLAVVMNKIQGGMVLNWDELIK